MARWCSSGEVRYGFDSENASVTSANSFKLNLLADTVSVSMNITLISTEETSSSINVTNENKTCNLTVTEKSLTKETCKEQEDLYGDYDDVFKMTMNYDEATPCLQEMLAKTIAASMQENSILYKKAAEETVFNDNFSIVKNCRGHIPRDIE